MSETTKQFKLKAKCSGAVRARIYRVFSCFYRADKDGHMAVDLLLARCRDDKADLTARDMIEPLERIREDLLAGNTVGIALEKGFLNVPAEEGAILDILSLPETSDCSTISYLLGELSTLAFSLTTLSGVVSR